jgi:hypothetical protein
MVIKATETQDYPPRQPSVPAQRSETRWQEARLLAFSHGLHIKKIISNEQPPTLNK